MNDLSVSILADSCAGPTQGTPTASRAFTIPFPRGASGPMTANSISFSFANLATSSTSPSSPFLKVDILLIPGLFLLM